MNVRSSAILFLVVCVFAAAAFGQTSPNLEAGFRPYGSYEGDFGIVNLANGGVTHHLGMPMAYPQRGGLGTVQPFIVINSKNWALPWID